MKLHGIASITMDTESGAALAQDMGVPVSKMEESIEAFLKTAENPDGEPYTAFPSGKSWDESLWQDGLREEVLPQRHFGSREVDPLLHRRFGNG